MAQGNGQSQSSKRRCPICGKPPLDRFRPFCSGRCADVDLSRWLGGQYRIPTNEAPDPGSKVEPDDVD